MDAAFGTETEIDVEKMETCPTCEGSGCKPGSTPQSCEYCGGVGQVRMQQGIFSVQQTCPACQGTGQEVSNPCPDCNGQGRKHETRTLSVKVPPGVDNGDRIRLAGEGEAGESGGPPGDLYVQIQVKQHPIFVREDNNLFCEVPISFTTAALGGQLAMQAGGSALDVGYYSRPDVVDWDNDETMDVVCGESGGRVRLFAGKWLIGLSVPASAAAPMSSMSGEAKNWRTHARRFQRRMLIESELNRSRA